MGQQDYNMSRLCLLGFLMICAAGARIVDQADPSNYAKLEKFVELTPFERVAELEPFDDGNVAELDPYEEVFAKLIENDEEEEEESFAELLLTMLMMMVKLRKMRMILTFCLMKRKMRMRLKNQQLSKLESKRLPRENF